MRTPNLGTAVYAPGVAPDDPKQVQQFLRDELQKISYAILALAAGHLDCQHIAPAKPRDGDIRYFDGTDYNPGAGRGVYIFKINAWVLLG